MMNGRPRLSLLPPLLAMILLVITAGEMAAQRLEVSPRALLFPCTVAGERQRMTITLRNTGSSPLSIRGFKVPNGVPFIVPGETNFVLGPNQRRIDTITFAPSTPDLQWDVFLVIAAGQETDSVRLRARSSPPPRIRANPDRLNFESAPGDDTTEQCLMLENPSCRPITITDLDISGGNRDYRIVPPMQLPATLDGGERRRICVELLPGPPGPVNERLTIETNTSGPVTVQLQGMRSGPGLVVTPGRGLDFRAVPVNTISHELRVGIVNLGIGPVNIPNNWELLGPDSTDFTVTPPSLPAQLSPRGADTIWFSVRFSPVDTGQKLARLRIGIARLPLALLRGVGVETGTVAAIPEVDMGPVLVGKSRTATDTLAITNDNAPPTELDRIQMTGPHAGQFTLTGPAFGPLPPGASLRYDVTFTPDGTGERTATALFHLRHGAIIPVRLRGTGTAREQHRFWIDTVTANVGERLELRLLASPDIAPSEQITRYTVTLRYAPTALYLHSSTGADGVDDQVDFQDQNGLVTVTHEGTTALSGPVLARFAMEGLASGRLENPVELVSVSLNDEASGTQSHNGLVWLLGCDIRRGVGFGRPVVARGAWPSPAIDELTIRYLAPSESEPVVGFIDLTGHRIPGPKLPQGTGEEQETTIRLDGLRPGFYLLELRSGTGRSALPVVIGGQ